jgi:very-short-patch-repair endonuclease
MSSLNERAFEKLFKVAFPRTRYIKQKQISYNGQILRFDFYIPSLNLYVEVQGQQHFTFNSFFYESDLDFKKQKRRDSLKEEWCEREGASFCSITDKELNKMTAADLKKTIVSGVK